MSSFDMVPEPEKKPSFGKANFSIWAQVNRSVARLPVIRLNILAPTIEWDIKRRYIQRAITSSSLVTFKRLYKLLSRHTIDLAVIGMAFCVHRVEFFFLISNQMVHNFRL